MEKKLLEKYAKVIVEVGLNLQEGQQLFIAAEMNTAPLVREVTAKAYQNGCPLVTVLWSDESLKKIRHEFAPRDSFEEYATWISDGILENAKRGDAYLSVTGLDPDLLAGYDPELIALELKTQATHLKPAKQIISGNGVQWTVVCPPTPKWAAKIFPEISIEEAEEKLWGVIEKLCRLNYDDPVAAWRKHLSELEKRHKYLTEKQFRTLEFRGPGTDLKIGMPENHLWKGGSGETLGGVAFSANLPTEEVFSLPHREKVNGVVRATKPLNYFGNLIENFSLTFEKGRVVAFEAEKGEATLAKMIETDENANMLGEVALVPHRSPISESGLIFFNTLYDENAACHLALGSAYRSCVKGGTEMSDEELDEAGVNDSLIHVDFMIGSGDVDIDGIDADGNTSPIMRNGEWAFTV